MKKTIGVSAVMALLLAIIPGFCRPLKLKANPEGLAEFPVRRSVCRVGAQVQVQKPKVVKRVAPVQLQPWTLWCEAAWEGTRFAVDMWLMQAHFRDIRINGPTAVGSRGCLTGPTLKSWIRLKMIERKVPDTVADKFAEGIATAWTSWQSGISVPGLPWYPQFAAFPGPTAPPTPNVPSPLSALPSSNGAALTNPANLAQRIADALGEEAGSQTAQDAIRQFARRFTARFTLWTAQVTVVNVLGQGPIPSFAPPFVPSGPVVDGRIIPSPPHLRSSQAF
jgi:hypothetical protein